MTKPECRVAPERRAFLRASGAMAAAATLSLPLNAWAHSQGTLPVSLLLPQPAARQGARDAFLDGFRSAIAAHDLPLAPTIFAFSGTAATMSEQLRQHLSNARSAALVGLLSRNQASGLDDLLSEAGLPGLICDIGADVVRDQHDSPRLLRHSLGYWQTSHAMGAWSAAHLGRRALIATDYLESGHDLVYAFHSGFVSAGGDIPSVQVNNAGEVIADLPALFAMIRAERPDFVYALYSGARARDFLAAYAQAGLGVPLAGPALLTQAVDEVKRFPHAEHVIQAASWPDAPCCPMAVLGFEAALRLAKAYQTSQASGESLAHALARTPVDGPRGLVTPDAVLADVQVRLHVQMLHRGIETLVTDQPVTSTTAAHMRGMLKTGWSAPYLLA